MLKIMRRFFTGRLLAIGLIAGMCASPALATPWDEYEAALDTFLGGYAAPSEFKFLYARSVLTNIAGTWLELNMLDGRADPSSPQPISADDFSRFCGLPFVNEVKVLDTLSFELVRAAASRSPVRSHFQAIGGAEFAFTSSPTEVLGRIGFDVTQAFEEDRVQWYNLLEGAAGTVQIFAPSENVRVFFPHGGQPIIMVRCA